MTSIGDKVYVEPVQEDGTVVNVRKDDRGELLITVRFGSTKDLHLCRECEISTIKENNHA